MTETGTRGRCRPLTAARLIVAWVALSALAPGRTPAVADAAEAEARLWHDKAHAMTLTLPPGWRALAEVPRGALVRFVGPGGEEDYSVIVSITQKPIYGPEDLLDVRQVLGDSITQIAAVQMARLSGEVVVLEQKDSFKVGEEGKQYDAGYVYFRIPDRRRSPIERIERILRERAGASDRVADQGWVLGQAVVQIGLATVVVLQLEVDEDRFAEVRPAFEALFNSLRLDVEQLAERRKALIDQFTAWRKQVRPEQWRAACIADQWYRVRDGAKDVGYMRIRQMDANRLNQAGLRVVLQTHFEDGKRSIDSKSDFFLSDDCETEIWSIRMTERPLHPRKHQGRPKELNLRNLKGEPMKIRGVNLEPDSNHWVETGVRTGAQLTVSREGATGVKEYQRVLPEAYLSQVELYLLGRLGATIPWEEIGFYAYFPSVGTITFQSVRLDPGEDNAYRLISRPTPNSPPTITSHDAAGGVMSQAIPGGRSLLPASRAELNALWPQK